MLEAIRLYIFPDIVVLIDCWKCGTNHTDSGQDIKTIVYMQGVHVYYMTNYHIKSYFKFIDVAIVWSNQLCCKNLKFWFTQGGAKVFS